MTIFQRLKAYSPSPAVWLFAGVLLVRLFSLARLTASPLLLPARGDMHFYNDWALRILRGEAGSPLAFYGLPGYPWFLSFLYRIFGYSPFLPGLVQALLDAGTAVLIYQLALRVWPAAWQSENRRAQIVGMGAAIGWAFFVPAETYAAILMPTAGLIFVFWFVVWRILRRDTGPGLLEYSLLGLLIGLTATAVATILFLLPLVLAASFLRRRPNSTYGRSVLAAALVFGGAAAGTSPCWIHNYFVARDPVALSAHSGINFWIGNNPEANGYPRFPPGLRAGQSAMLEDSITRAEEAAGHPLKRAQVSAYWSNKAREWVRAHPAEWLGLLLIKLRNFWNAFQYDDLSIISSLREEEVVLPGLYFGLVATMAIPGLLLAWRYAPLSRWIAAAIFLHMASLMTVFVTERYRLPVVPGLLVFAAFGLFFHWRSLARAELKPALSYFLLVCFSAAFVAWPQRNPSLWALDAYNSGWQALESGKLDLAQEKLELAYAYVPTNPETNFALGNVSLARGDLDQAKVKYINTLSYDINHKGALNNLGIVALREGDWQWAENYFRGALKIDPRDGKTHYLLARACLEEGKRSEAAQEIDEALALRPGQTEFSELKAKIEQAPATP